jgi:hypothetical protein
VRGSLRASRRALLAGGVGALGLAAGTMLGPGSAAASTVDARRRAMTFLDSMMDAHADSGPVGLPQSYSDQVGLFATGFTYDAAMAILAYLADDRPESADRAARLGEALCYAQQHDPQFSDGRLRQAYNVGPYTMAGVEQPDGFVRDDGTVNIGGAFGFTASGTGEQAWAALALCALHRNTGDGRMIDGAIRLGSWVADTCRPRGALGGFTDGVDRAGGARTNVVTAHNADLVALFGQLAAVTGDRSWLVHRDAAAAFVASMWNPPRQIFFWGAVDGHTVDRTPMVLDAQTHSWLALGNPSHVGCLDSARRQLTVVDTAAAPNSSLTGSQSVTGLTVSTASRTADPAVPIEPGLARPDPAAVWLEGTAQFMVALRHSPAGALATTTVWRALADVQDQLGAGQTVADQPIRISAGLVAASSPLHVGYVRSGYYPAKHVAATAWFALAAVGENPLAETGGATG